MFAILIFAAMARLMAFDYGTKRTGIAVTDDLQMIATGLGTFPSHELISFLKKYLENEQVEKFIVGEPKQMDGTPSQSAKYCDLFAKSLKNHFPMIPVVRVDERFTSKMASRTILEAGLKKKDRRDKALVDKISAVIILQGFLESNLR